MGVAVAVAVAAQGLIGMGRWWWERASDDGGETPTRSHDGHMVSVVGGVICM